MTKSRNILPPRHVWTDAQISVLRDQYPNKRTADIAATLQLKISSVYQKANSLGLKKSDEFFASYESGRTNGKQGGSTRFQPGIEVWNKGKKIGSRGRSAETQFKPGVRQGVARELYKPIGSERISKDGYLERKINDDMPLQKRWRAAHIVMWEEVNGPLPAGHALVFKDRNKQNISLDNLELITRQELMKRNSYRQYGPEIAQVVQLRGALTRQINRKEKQS